LLVEGSLRRGSVGLNLFAVLLITSGVGLANTRQIGFEERVRAQEAIERVYYSHQVGATKPFEEAVPRRLLERKVRDFVKQSAALAKYWQTAVTEEALVEELRRIEASTRLPVRLREVREALGNDQVLLLECLVRPALVDRLSRNFFSGDARIHAVERRLGRTAARRA